MNSTFKSSLRLSALLLLLSLAGPGYGQVQDFLKETRLVVAANKSWKLDKKFRLYAGQTLQFRDDFTALSGADKNPEPDVPFWQSLRSLTTFAAEYRITKNLRLRAGDMFFVRPGANMHRVHLDLTHFHKLSKEWRLQTRLRTHRDITREEGEWEFSDYARLRSRIQFRSVVRPFVDTEILYRLDGARKGWDRSLSNIGIDIPVGKHTFRTAYRYQYLFGRKTPGSGLLILRMDFWL